MIGQSHSCAIESTVAQSSAFVSRFFFLGKAVNGALLALFILVAVASGGGAGPTLFYPSSHAFKMTQVEITAVATSTVVET